MTFVKCFCCQQKKRNSEDSLSSNNHNNSNKNKKRPLWKTILIWSLTVFIIILLLIFILIWVVVPIAFCFSIAFQRMMIFMPFNQPKNPDFNNPLAYGITGVKNFYITVKDNNATITQIGAWLILPEQDKDSALIAKDISEIIENTAHDILFYFHGVLANRAQPIMQYEVFRKQFLIIAIDHRGYGDSGENVDMTEVGMVNDHVQIYDWLAEKNFKKNIYYWGHSMGSAISCHTLKALKEQRNFVPKGLILESAFTTLQEEIVNMFLGKMYKWLAYFDATILKPLDQNGFHFRSVNNILQVDCPIMILHAEDDMLIPYFLGEKLAEVARTQRDLSKQGNVTFYLFPSSEKYNHNKILLNPNITAYIDNFKEICELFEEPR